MFAAVGLGSFTGVMTFGTVNVALPTIAGYFETDLPTVQWVVIAQTLTVSALLLPMGRLSDMVGRKQVYIAGLLLLMGASVFAASSQSVLMLVMSRVVQGMGAAMTQGTGMAMITSVFPANERGKGIGTHMSVIGAGGMVGPVIGGLLVSALGWRWVFLVNLPLASIALLGALLLMDSKLFFRERRGARFDWQGAALSTAALVTFLMLMTNGYRLGWTSPIIVSAAALFAALLAGFVWWELRASAPMLDMSLFRRRVFSMGVLASFVSFLSVASVRFIMPFYLQGALRYAPRQVGLIMLPTAITMTIMGPIAGRLSDRYGYRAFNVAGLLMASAGIFTISRVSEADPAAADNRRDGGSERGDGAVRLAQFGLDLCRRAGQQARRGIGAAQLGAKLRQRDVHSGGDGGGCRHDGLDGLRAGPGRRARRRGRRGGSRLRFRHERAVQRDGLPAAGGRGGVFPEGACASRRGARTSAGRGAGAGLNG